MESRPAAVATKRRPSQRAEEGTGATPARGRDAPLGGQAVLEGVMMRGVGSWAVAVRLPPPEAPAQAGAGAGERAGEIEVQAFPLRSAMRRHRILRWPIIRGVAALGGSLAVGMRALEIAANAQLPREQPQAGAPPRLRSGGDPAAGAYADGAAPGEPAEEPAPDAASEEIPRGVWAGTVLVAIAFAIVLFFVVPVGLTSLIKQQLGSPVLFWLVEGVLRTGIFLGYLVLLSRIGDLRRVFEYHGAEHKTISCYEAGDQLTPANCARFSRLHPRCGTSFLLVVMIVAIFVFAPIGLPAWYWLVLTRIVGVPLIAGISFELIRFAGRNRDRRWVQVVMWPGLKLQLLTTREPDHSQLAVAIAALQAVLAREDPARMGPQELIGVEVVA